MTGPANPLLIQRNILIKLQTLTRPFLGKKKLSKHNASAFIDKVHTTKASETKNSLSIAYAI